MGFKSIELQIAIPRTQDAGKLQEQMMKQGQQFQETLTEQHLREEMLKRQQVNKSDPTEQSTINEKDDQQTRDEQQQSKKKQENDMVERNHPFLGKNVDFTG